MIIDIVQDICETSWEEISQSKENVIEQAIASAKSRCSNDSYFHKLFFSLIASRFNNEKIKSKLFSPVKNEFIISIFLLLVRTSILLWGVTYVYLLFDKTINAPLKFGVIGTIIGLALDKFSLSNHHMVFPKLNDSQIIVFTAWMSFAYALYLFIPLIFYRKTRI